MGRLIEATEACAGTVLDILLNVLELQQSGADAPFAEDAETA